MSMPRNPGKPRLVLTLLLLGGGAMLSIPFFLTPPAYLDLVVHDPVFASDFTARQASVVNDATGKLFKAIVQKVGSNYVARVGRIDSGIGTYSVQLDGFKRANARVDAAPLQQVRQSVALSPTFGRLHITPVSATLASQSVPATLREGTRQLASEPQRLITIDLPPGKHRLTAQAAGFCASEREFDVREGKVTTAQFPLSPDLRPDELARFVLHWPNEPDDLDAHFRRIGTRGARNPEHAFFGHKEARSAAGSPIARLDVDMQRPQGYETVTVRNSVDGDFEYYVHLYAGRGTIGGSGATVQVYTAGCQVKTLAAPPSCAQNIWTVANIRNTQGRVEVLEQQRCETNTSLLFGGKAPQRLP